MRSHVYAPRARLLLPLLVLAGLAIAPMPADAQECSVGNDICTPAPPCYREPDNPDCNADCHAGALDYPTCDPYCAPGDICDPDGGNHCWDDVAYDVCSDDPPHCTPGPLPPFTFVDDRDGNDNGQIYALGDRNPQRGCGTLRVDKTGYYQIFDTELSESCDDQLDETGYVTITNSCNGDGWAVERNAGERFLVFDSDNTPECASDADCAPGRVCRPGTNHGNCCVPEDPVFMGTFLLVEGEDNVICINHWCPDWRAEIAAGRDYGFVVANCEGVNSIHFRIGATAIACEDENTLQPCSWGCNAGTCNPDPCDAMSCADFCKDGVCLDDNPCANLSCEHGCVRGRCLQNRHARGPDLDGDGFTELADCDDSNPAANPDQREICVSGADEDCDGFTDELDCRVPSSGGTGDGGTSGSGGGLMGGSAGGGCGCTAATPTGVGALVWLLLAGTLRRRR